MRSVAVVDGWVLDNSDDPVFGLKEQQLSWSVTLPVHYSCMGPMPLSFAFMKA
jgi:hypothetical protein